MLSWNSVSKSKLVIALGAITLSGYLATQVQAAPPSFPPYVNDRSGYSKKCLAAEDEYQRLRVILERNYKDYVAMIDEKNQDYYRAVDATEVYFNKQRQFLKDILKGAYDENDHGASWSEKLTAIFNKAANLSDTIRDSEVMEQDKVAKEEFIRETKTIFENFYRSDDNTNTLFTVDKDGKNSMQVRARLTNSLAVFTGGIVSKITIKLGTRIGQVKVCTTYSERSVVNALTRCDSIVVSADGLSQPSPEMSGSFTKINTPGLEEYVWEKIDKRAHDLLMLRTSCFEKRDAAGGPTQAQPRWKDKGRITYDRFGRPEVQVQETEHRGVNDRKDDYDKEEETGIVID